MDNTVNKQRYREFFPLHAALAIGSTYLAREHLKMKTPVKTRDGFNKTTLHCAIEGIIDPDSRYEICYRLINLGVNVNDSDEYDKTPLHYLLGYESGNTNDYHGKLFKLLISKGADINKKSFALETPIFCAVTMDNYKATRRLLALKVNPNQENINGVSLLTRTIEKGSVELMKLLLSYGANVNDGRAIYTAAKSSRMKYLRVMFNYGADLGKIDFTPCHENGLLAGILWQKSADAVGFLLEKGLDILIGNKCALNMLWARHSEWQTLRMSLRDENSIVECRRKMCELIKHIAVLMEIDRQLLKDTTLRLLRDYVFVKQFFIECKNQVELMNKTPLNKDSEVTYFDMMVKKGRELLKYCDDENNVIISSVIPENLFPAYVKRLRRNFQSGRFEKKGRDRIHQFIYNICKTKFTSELISTICDHLEMKDLTVFLLRHKDEPQDLETEKNPL